MSLAPVPDQPTALEGIDVDRAAILRTLNLDPRDANVQALVLVCQQYGLDPVLKHAVLIKGNLYVTRDGLLHVAHKSGRLDGIVVDEEGEDDRQWWARVTVYVKGQGHGYTYRGRYPKSGTQQKYGPEMAVKCAEVMALRRAFGVTGITTIEEQWDKHDDAIDTGLAPDPQPEPAGEVDPVPSFVDPPGNPDAKHAGKGLPGWLKGLHAEMGAVFGDIPKRQMDLYRRQLVIAVTGEGKSSRDLTEPQRDAFRALLDGYRGGAWHFADNGDDWKIAEGPAPGQSWIKDQQAKLALAGVPTTGVEWAAFAKERKLTQGDVIRCAAKLNDGVAPPSLAKLAEDASLSSLVAAELAE